MLEKGCYNNLLKSDQLFNCLSNFGMAVKNMKCLVYDYRM